MNGPVRATRFAPALSWACPASLELQVFPSTFQFNAMTSIRLLVALFVAVGAASALAQTPAPAAPATAAGGRALPASTCVKPGHYPGKKASDVRKEAWMNEMKAWGDCATAFVADLRAQIDARIKLANSTIEDYNAGLKVLQEEQRDAEARPGSQVIR